MPPRPSNCSVVLVVLLPRSVSSKFDPRRRETPVKVSVPIEVPVAELVPISAVTPEVAETNETRVPPLPVMVSLPPIPSNSLRLEPSLDALRLAPPNPTAL